MTLEEMKQLKAKKGLTIEQISARSGVPVGTLSKIFAGLTKKPRTAALDAIERVLTDESFLEQGKANYYEILSEDAKSAFIVKENPSPWGSGTGSEKADPDAGKDDSGYSNRYDPSVFKGTGIRWKKQGEYTVDDYLALPDDVRVELIDGVFFYMDAPSFLHQTLVMEFTLRLHDFVRNGKGQCRVCPSPVDVQLDNDNRTMVQPDIIVVCDRDKIRRRVHGAPDLCIEILSRSSKDKDRRIKHYKYARAGVREYWIVDPFAKSVVVYNYDKDDEIRIYGFDSRIPVGIWDNKCSVDMKEIWEAVQDLEAD